MATYEYRCDGCRKTFTVSQSIVQHEAKPKPACPKCKSRKTRQQFGSFFVKTASKS